MREEKRLPRPVPSWGEWCRAGKKRRTKQGNLHRDCAEACAEVKPICADSAGLPAEPHEEEEKKEACRGEHVGTEALKRQREKT